MYNDLLNMFDGFTNLFENYSIQADVEKNDDGYLVTIDVPGVKKEDISLSMENQELTVNIKNEPVKKEYISRERVSVRGTRSFYLKDAVDDTVKARIENGVLYVTVETKKASSRDIVIE